MEKVKTNEHAHNTLWLINTIFSDNHFVAQ